MIAILIKVILIGFLVWIAIQDFKERKVWNYHFIIFGALGSYLFYKATTIEFYLFSILANIVIVLTILLVTTILMRVLFKRKTGFLGFGDVFFFFAFAISFPIVSFINFFVFSILFTFVLHLLVKKKYPNNHKTIPLAGFMSLFLSCIYISHWLSIYQQIYVL